MSNYLRIIPRDLFNEANLLKCYGRLWILLDETRGHHAELVEVDNQAFDVVQNAATGGITIRNLRFMVGGTDYHLERPLNSREPWPLYVETEDDSVAVFDDAGNFTDEMRALIGATSREA